MYSTVQELHIEIEQRIQQITSNRNGSIAPEFIDMVLNRNAIRYVNLKTNRKTNYKQEGFEDSKKRLEDLESLKVTTTLEVRNPKDLCILPSDFHSLISSTSNYLYSKSKDDFVTTTAYLSFYYLNMNDIIDWIDKIGNNKWNLKYQTYRTDNPTEFTAILTDQSISMISSDIFDNVDYLQQALKQAGFNAYWEEIGDIYVPNTLVVIISDDSDDSVVNRFEFYIDDHTVEDLTINKVEYLKYFFHSTTYSFAPTKISPNDLISSEKIPSILQDYYGNKNRHLNPIIEIKQGVLYVYTNDNFKVKSVDITYIKKPRKFDVNRNIMSDLTITPEFMDMVVSDLLLILKDNSFNYVQQKTNLE